MVKVVEVLVVVSVTEVVVVVVVVVVVKVVEVLVVVNVVVVVVVEVVEVLVVESVVVVAVLPVVALEIVVGEVLPIPSQMHSTFGYSWLVLKEIKDVVCNWQTVNTRWGEIGNNNCFLHKNLFCIYDDKNRIK